MEGQICLPIRPVPHPKAGTLYHSWTGLLTSAFRTWALALLLPTSPKGKGEAALVHVCRSPSWEGECHSEVTQDGPRFPSASFLGVLM